MLHDLQRVNQEQQDAFTEQKKEAHAEHVAKVNGKRRPFPPDFRVVDTILLPTLLPLCSPPLPPPCPTARDSLGYGMVRYNFYSQRSSKRSTSWS